MKCYYHNLIDVVATCRECGKHLCKECYDKGQKGTCNECFVTMHKETVVRNKKYHYSYIKKSLIALTVGVIIGLIIATGMAVTPETQSHNVFANFRLLNFAVVPIMLGYIAFSLYWGLNIFSKILKKILALGMVLIYKLPTLIIVLCTAVFIGLFAGIPMFIYHLAKFIRARTKKKAVLGSLDPK